MYLLVKEFDIVDEFSDWKWWVTPRLLKKKPVHNWYTFPHSFSCELVYTLIDKCELNCNDYILDPFAGAGTTILSAKEKNVPAKGYDISPLSILVSNVKLANYQLPPLETTWSILAKQINPSNLNSPSRDYPKLVKKALPGKLLGAFESIDRDISSLLCSDTEKLFFRLALISILPYYSRAVATGGWLKWVRKNTNYKSIKRVFTERVNMMIDDIKNKESLSNNSWIVEKCDSRCLPDDNSTYSAVITSPPYPNRHDYTRVFGVELMFSLLNWEETRAIRYQSFQSHPESKPIRPDSSEYKKPQLLANTINKINNKSQDQRISKMLEGYFLDMFLSLREIKRVCKANARIAYILGNAQYFGIPILVDEITAEIGEQVGLTCEKILVARYRGNSAQQMGKYGRIPSRESILLFKK